MMTRSTASLLSRQYSLRTQQLPDDFNMLRVVDSHQHDGQVAGYPDGATSRRAPVGSCREFRAARAARHREYSTRLGNALKSLRLVDVDAQLPQLCFEPASGARVFARSKAATSRCLPASASTASRLGADPQSKNRRVAVSPGAMRTRRRSASTGSNTVPDGVGQRTGIDDRDGIAQVAAAAEKARSIRFELQVHRRPLPRRRYVGQPQPGSAGLAGAAGGEQARRSRRRIPFARRAWRRPDVPNRAARRQHRLRHSWSIRFHVTRLPSLVNRNPADLGIVVGRHQDLECG